MKDLIGQELTEEEACAGDYEVRVKFKSLTSEYGLYCENNYLKQSYEFLTILCSTVLTILFTLFQDTLGRKKIILMGFVLGCVSCFCIYFGRSLESKVIGIMLLWSFMEIAYTAFAILSNELLVNPIRNLSVPLYSVLHCVGGLTGNVTAKFVHSYVSILTVNYIGYFVTVVLIALFIPESPSFLLKRSKDDELRAAITYMCNSNGVPPPDLPEIEQGLEAVIKSKLFNF